MQIPNSFVQNYLKSHYRIVGKHLHSAIKPCHWFEQRLLTGRDNRNCYKGYFGIKSHLCLQNTPALPFCNQSCVFCWRDIEHGTIGAEFSTTPDDPRQIIDEMIRHQRDMLDNHITLEKSLLNLQSMRSIANLLLDRNPRTLPEIAQKLHFSSHQTGRAVNVLKNTQILRITEDLKHLVLHPTTITRLEEGVSMELIIEQSVTTEQEIREAHKKAYNPGHAAISLGGEPILYPFISEFVAEFRRRRFTTFIVTNGTRPDLIKKMDSLPTQLYVSMPVDSPENYKRICRPVNPTQWDQFLETLDLLSTLSSRTCIRVTAIQSLNMQKIAEYARLIERANPNFIDVKAFALEAAARLIGNRLKGNAPVKSFQPTFRELQIFAQRLSEAGNFPILEQVKKSGDILLGCNWPEGKSILINQL
ncbi:MAG: tRNA-modifying protein [Promethearchaeota archaeon CR_4]|nr:MAG: tRNA-modifying protein [Candidatus Lokiarchaeota archaeon CR_4]